MGTLSTKRVRDLRSETADASATHAIESNQTERKNCPVQSDGIELLIWDYRENFYIDNCH